MTTQYQTMTQYSMNNFNGAWRLKWLFFSKRKKEGYQDQFKRYDQFKEENYSKIKQLQALSKTLEAKSLETIWREFQQSSARFYAFLEKFLNQEIDISQVTKGNILSEEILRKIQAFELNTDKLNVSLRGWQEFGAKYALVQEKVLLGDEMGLGKTIEALAVLTHLATQGAQYFLVVCPASIMINWIREIKEHSQLTGFLVHGSDRDMILEKWKESGGIAVTTYETLQRLDFLDMEELDALIVDEAHYIKNPAAKRSQRVFNLTKKSVYTMFMTGTPIENNVIEMINLIRELNPEIAEKLIDSPRLLNAELYKKEISPVYLRRNREDVLTELPELTQIEEWEEFGKQEVAIYKQAVIHGKFMLMRRAGWQGKEPKKSPKLQRLLEICEEARVNGKKVIVFSFFKSVIEIVANTLGENALEPITGNVTTKRRQEILDEFKNNPDKNVLIAQVQAGGVGLNIQIASIIIFCEPQLKPSLETQAIARAYRIGQTRNVFVYRLLTEDSIDERLLEMLGNKQALFDQYAKDSLIGETAPQAKDISEKSIKNKIVQIERERLLGNTNDLLKDEDEWDF
ncbi:DEAD/DEAH box helicase [Enterococcus saccharolyticus]|uniref:DEAD/DEAH box helicase n=1 Tax=Enterococcus TaxID=1350 RepID=UPI001E2B0703|nr:DEAD/DEAH box helicase [Enterococcus saccharolyticus]MCD5003671.1 DEAD/DEAH box helicase [Enterococcus saccharolyticus]